MKLEEEEEAEKYLLLQGLNVRWFVINFQDKSRKLNKALFQVRCLFDTSNACCKCKYYNFHPGLLICEIVTHKADQENSQSQSPWVLGGWESWTSGDVGENKRDEWAYRGQPYSVDFNRMILN